MTDRPEQQFQPPHVIRPPTHALGCPPPHPRARRAGGIIFGRYHDALIDTALGLLGGALVAQGLITMALADVLDAETAAKFKVEEYYLFYVAGIAVVIEVLRAFITGARENATSAAAAAWHPRSKTPAGRASAAKVSPAAEKAKALSKATPSKAMH